MSAIYGCGYNELWPLGIDTKGRAVTRPTLILPTWANVLEVSAAASHTMGHFPDGSIQMVGGNDYDAACDGQAIAARQQIIKSPVRVDVPVARAFSMCESSGAMILTDGTGRTWAGNILGQAGIGTSTGGAERLEPPGVYTTPQTPAFSDTLSAIGGGQYHKLAITTAGLLDAWARNDAGQLGLGKASAPVLAPKPVDGLTDLIALAGGAKHSIVLRGDGVPLGAGRGKLAQFGTPEEPDRSTFAPIEGLTGVRAIAAGGSLSAFLLDDGSAYYCGRGRPLTRLEVPAPVTFIAIGVGHIAVVADGEGWTQGLNEWGQLGDGTREDKPRPVPTGVGCRAISCSPGHTVFLGD